MNELSWRKSSIFLRRIVGVIFLGKGTGELGAKDTRTHSAGFAHELLNALRGVLV
jgi:hypothetical protein